MFIKKCELATACKLSFFLFFKRWIKTFFIPKSTVHNGVTTISCYAVIVDKIKGYNTFVQTRFIVNSQDFYTSIHCVKNFILYFDDFTDYLINLTVKYTNISCEFKIFIE